MKSPYQEEMNSLITDEGFGRFSKSDIVLLRTFKDNVFLLKCLRKVILQIPLTDEEFNVMSKTFNGNKDLFNAVKNIFEPIGEDVDLLGGTRWSDRKYVEFQADDVKILVLSRKDSIDFVSKGMERLEDITNGGQGQPKTLVIDIGMKGDYESAGSDEIKRKTVAFQDSMIYLDNCFMVLNLLVTKEEETIEQRDARLKKNSSK